MSRFRRRLMGLAALRQAKADDYVRVEYIENTSTAYIDTLIKPNNNTRIEAEFSINRFDDTYSQFLFGARTSLSSNKFYIINDVRTQNINWHFKDKNIKGNVDIQINEKWKVSNNGGTLTYTNGTNTYTLSVANGSFSCPHSITIFAMNNNGVPTIGTNSFDGKYYSFKIYNGSTLVRDYIPMYQISTDTYGLWDRVNEEFYTSPNGVKFTGGERVIADADDNLYYIKNYISTTGTYQQYINLKTFTTDNSVEFEVLHKDTTDNWFGCRAVRQSLFFALQGYSSNFNYCYAANPISITKISVNHRYKIKYEDKKVYLNNTLIHTEKKAVFTTGNVVRLGAVYGHNNTCMANFYYFKWWDSNKDLVYDMIPVQSVSDGVWGMFCKVHNKFYPSNGSAQFTGG